MNERLLAQLKRDEGSVRDAAGFHISYRCPAGKLTIGYGHNLDANPIPGLHAKSAITEEYAERILRHDTEAVTASLTRALPWTINLDPPRFAVLVNMAFNMGLEGLLKWKNTLECIKAGDFTSASLRMDESLWARQVKCRAVRLIKQMNTGEWQ